MNLITSLFQLTMMLDLTGRRSLWLGGALLVLLTVAAYAPALRGDFLWDDDDYVSQNATLRSADGLRQIWLEPSATVQYYPLTFTVFWGYIVFSQYFLIWYSNIPEETAYYLHR